MEERREWRLMNGRWHFTEHFPEGTRYRSACNQMETYGLFDKISKEFPTDGIVCKECARKYKLGAKAFQDDVSV